MNSKDSTILAVGATGQFAGLVVPELAQRGAKVRGLIRDVKQRDTVLRNGAAEVAIGDLSDRASLDKALKGVDSVFYIAPAFIPDEAAIGKSMVEAAKQAGVRRFVFSSVIDPILSAPCEPCSQSTRRGGNFGLRYGIHLPAPSAVLSRDCTSLGNSGKDWYFFRTLVNRDPLQPS